MAVNDLITFRKGTSSQWSTVNPVLYSGEPGYDVTNKIFKVGDGYNNWNNLSSINLTSSNITNFNSSVSGLITDYALLNSPSLTGIPLAPTASVDTNTNQIASTAFVLGQAASITPIVNGTASIGTSTRFARADHIHPTDTSRAALTGAAFTGSISAPSGNFTQTLQINGTGVSISGHTHTSSNISDSTAAGRALLTGLDAIAQRVSLGLGTLATQNGTFSGTSSGTNTGDQTISISGDVTAAGSTGSLNATVIKINGVALSGLSTGLLKNTSGTGQPSIAIAGTDYAAVSHNHTSSNITDFNTSVSGLLPVTNIVAGNNITISSASGVYTINSTASGTSGGSSTSVLEYNNVSNFPVTGVSSIIYINTDTGRIYRWAGSVYQELGPISYAPIGSDSRWNLFLPPAPTGVSATAGNSAASVSWGAPSVSAQTPITDYSIQYSSNSGIIWTTFNDGVSTSTTTTVTGLTNGSYYTFRVLATNAIGNGPWSNASSAIYMGDIYFSNISTLLHFDGTNNSTSYADNASTPKTYTSYGSAAINTSTSKFGGSSLYLNGNNAYIVSNTSSDFGMGTGDFTFEGWYYPTVSLPNGTWANIMNFGTYVNGVLLRISSVSGTSKDTLYIAGTQLNAPGDYLSDANVPVNQWTHIALTRSGSSVRLFLNGTQYGSTMTSSANAGSSLAMTVGKSAHISAGTNQETFTGFIDDIRVTKGIARYTSNFTPPGIAFVDG